MKAIAWGPYFFPKPGFSRLLPLPQNSALRPSSASSLKPTQAVPPKQISSEPTKTSLPISETSPVPDKFTEDALSQFLPCGFSRIAILTAASIGLAMLVAAMDAQKALALGIRGDTCFTFLGSVPGPSPADRGVAEESHLCDSHRRHLVSQVLNAMVGITEFS